MILFKIIIPVILGVAGMFWLASFLTYRPKYKYYKETYLAIKNKDYIMSSNDESFIIFTSKDKPSGAMFGFNQWQFDAETILYFKSDETIKLTSGYIHKDFMPFFDPYTQYWHWKIKKEMLLHTRSIAEIREDKLKQLKIW
jgi:uncharacterized SAM-binding protein YcdF (DUF218 family)